MSVRARGLLEGVTVDDKAVTTADDGHRGRCYCVIKANTGSWFAVGVRGVGGGDKIKESGFWIYCLASSKLGSSFKSLAWV